VDQKQKPPETTFSSYSFPLRSLQRRLTIVLGLVWLVAFLIGTASIAYFVAYTNQSAWLLLGLWLFLLVASACWVTALTLKHLVSQPLAELQAKLPPLDRDGVSSPQIWPEQVDNDSASADGSSSAPDKPRPKPEFSERRWTNVELKQLEEKLNRSTWFRFEAIIVHEKVKILGVSDEFATLFGYTPDEITGSTILELSAPESHGIILRNILLKYDRPYQIICLKKDGLTFPVELCSKSMQFQDHPVTVMAFREATELGQKQVLEALNKAHDELESNLGKSATQLRFSNERLRLELHQRKQMEAELKARARQQAAIAELGQRALVGSNLSIVMYEADLLVTETLQVEYTGILKLDRSDNSLLLRSGIGWNEGLVGQARIKANRGSPAGYALLTGRPVIVKDLAKENRFKQPPLLHEHKVVSTMTVIIQGREEPFGVLGAHTTKQRTFTEDDIHFLQAIANVLASAIERKEAEGQIVQRNRELLSLQSAGAAIMSSLDPKHVLNAVNSEMVSLLNADACIVSNWNEADDSISVLSRYDTDQDDKTEVASESYQLARLPLTRQVLIGRIALQRTINQADLDPTETAYMHQNRIKTRLLLPMVFQGRVIGLVDIIDRQTERTFSQQDIALATLIANQAASAIENARFYAETRKILREQIALRQAGAIISSTLDLDAVLNYIAEQMGQIVDVTSVYIFSFEPETKSSTVLAEYIGPEACPAEQTAGLGTTYDLASDFPGTAELLQAGQTDVNHLDDEDLSEPERLHMQQFGAQTTLTIPLQVGGRMIAYAELWESRFKREFSSEEIALCQDIAQQAAIAIGNARLFEQTQEALEETAVLYRVAQTLAQLDNEQEMYELVLAEYLQHLGLQQGGVLIFDPDKAYGSLKAHMVDGRLIDPGLRIPVTGNPSYDQLMENMSVVVVQDAPHNTLLAPARDLTLKLGIKSLLLVPIIARGEVVGALGADSTEENRDFTAREIALVKAMANQLGIAIENIRLYAETERRAEQLAVLHELDRAITTSLHLDNIHFAFARHATRLLAYDRISIALLDGNDMRVTYAVSKDRDGMAVPVGTTVSRQTSAAGWVVNQGQPLIRHAATDASAAEDDGLIGPGIQSSMIIPLRIKGGVIGTWILGSQQVGAYSPDELEIAQAMADQLAVAIENARLFDQAEQEISDRKRAEAALGEERALLAERVEERTADLQAANLELARASRLKDEFLASMSHELRTPLTAILGLCDVLKLEVYGSLTKKQTRSINNIEDSGRHLLELINDILDLSKIEAGKLELQIGPVSINAVCQSSLKFVNETAHKKSIDLSLKIDSAVSTLQADDRRLKQILVNLMSNAVKFTDEGGSVSLEVTGDPEAEQIHFAVSDTGIGISEEERGHLFQPFVQLDSSLSRQYSGTGLGLALVRRMVEMHGGEINVDSQVGQGSRFTVSLPWPDETKSGTDATKAAKKPGQAVKSWRVPASSLISAQSPAPQILVAEDDIRLSSILGDYLRAKGYDVTSVRNGLEFLEQAKAAKPDLILTDVHMPQLDGLEAVRKLRADDHLATTPVIVLTALAMPGDRERCLEAGANEYLTKPIDFDGLVETIETHLSSTEAEKKV
jgi:PAS domain S-box-containing protein